MSTTTIHRNQFSLYSICDGYFTNGRGQIVNNEEFLQIKNAVQETARLYSNPEKLARENEWRELAAEKRIQDMYDQPIEKKEKPPPKIGFVYLAKDTVRGCFKIGFTQKVGQRIKQLKTANAGIELYKFYDGYYETEIMLHEAFKKSGKWISSEWFNLDESDLQQIENYFNPILDTPF